MIIPHSTSGTVSISQRRASDPAIFSHTHCVFHVKLQPAVSRLTAATEMSESVEEKSESNEKTENIEEKTDVKIEVKTEGDPEEIGKVNGVSQDRDEDDKKSTEPSEH